MVGKLLNCQDDAVSDKDTKLDVLAILANLVRVYDLRSETKHYNSTRALYNVVLFISFLCVRRLLPAFGWVCRWFFHVSGVPQVSRTRFVSTVRFFIACCWFVVSSTLVHVRALRVL